MKRYGKEESAARRHFSRVDLPFKMLNETGDPAVKGSKKATKNGWIKIKEKKSHKGIEGKI